MHFRWMRYACSFSILLIAVGAFAATASAAPLPLHPTLSVRCGTGTYSTIQAAVNAAGGGYTIKVCAGEYNENVNVNDATMHGVPPFNTLDGLHIIGDGWPTLECPGSGSLATHGSGFDLHASSVTIEGFNIEDCASGISVESGYGGELFQLNNINNNVVGITFNNSAIVTFTIINQSGNNSVVLNLICNNSGDGIFDFQAQGDYFFANIVHDNGGSGIEISTTPNVSCTVALQCGGEYSAVIVDNDVEHNAANGVYLNHANDTNVRSNTLSQNGNDGLYANTSSVSAIAANDADQNHNNGVELSSTSSGNQLTNNRMQQNTGLDATDHDSNFWLNNHCKTTGGSATCVP